MKYFVIAAVLLIAGTSLAQKVSVGTDSTPPKWQTKTLPDCDGASNALQFDTTTREFSCATVSGSGATLSGPTSGTYNPGINTTIPNVDDTDWLSTTFNQLNASEKISCTIAGQWSCSAGTGCAMSVRLKYGSDYTSSYFNTSTAHDDSGAFTLPFVFTGGASTGNRTVTIQTKITFNSPSLYFQAGYNFLYLMCYGVS